MPHSISRVGALVFRRALLPVAALMLGGCAVASRSTTHGSLVTDRPDFTESAETVPVGLVQLESGTTFSRTLDERTQSIGEGLFRIGLAERLELRVGVNSYALLHTPGSIVRGFEDASVGAKVKLFDGGGEGSLLPVVAVMGGTSVPTGGVGFGADLLQPDAKLALAWDLTSRVAFASNINYALVRERFGSHGEPSVSGSFAFGVTDALGSYVEYYAFFPRSNALPSTRFVNGGVTYGFSPNFQVDARGGIGMNRLDGPDYFIGLGFARRW